MVAKPRNSGQWTESRYRSFIVSTIRKSSARWGPKNEAKKDARHFEKLPNPKGRLVFHSCCAMCNAIIPETTSSVDHIEPVIDPKKGFVSWDEYITRMYCEREGFQVLCSSCHSIKQNVSEENVHNLNGRLPSDFSEVEGVELRNQNRGAVLANIYERYTTEDSDGGVYLLPQDFRLCTRELEHYMARIPRNEKHAAKSQMYLHLEKRGFSMGNG